MKECNNEGIKLRMDGWIGERINKWMNEYRHKFINIDDCIRIVVAVLK